jgi:hypothetical protein
VRGWAYICVKEVIMGKASGVVLIMAGLGVAAFLIPLGSDADQKSPQTGSMAASAAEGERTASAVATKAPQAQSASTVVASRPRAAAPLAAAAVQPPTSSHAPIVITLSHRADTAARPPVPATKVLPHPSDRTSIVRELQKELKRVGCYDGEINAIWTPMTRKAIKDFTDRVNASLPVDQPDNILLSLVLGQQDKACGRSCPAGEGLSQDGSRCVPSAILAQAAKKAAPMVAAVAPKAPPAEKPTAVVTGWSTTTTTAAATVRPASAGPPLDGRMALAGPKTDTAPPVGRQGPDSVQDIRSRDRRADMPRPQRAQPQFDLLIAGFRR